MALPETFAAHLATGSTTVARCWALTRRDATVFGFTDHDQDIGFDGLVFRADTGLTARALQQTTGLSIDNSEALGALSASAVTEADIEAGRYDGATVEAWLVNWANPEDRVMQFRGSIGEIVRVAGAFRAELVGLSEALNTVQGRVYQRQCTAVLGDGDCGVDLADPAFAATATVVSVEDPRRFRLSGLEGHAGGWFTRGRLRVTSGAAQGLLGVVKSDKAAGGVHTVELWESLRAEVAAGDTMVLDAGCDKRAATCREKFANLVNFRGFPDMPGDGKLMSIPLRTSSTASGAGAK